MGVVIEDMGGYSGEGNGQGQSPNMLSALLSVMTAEKLGVEVKPKKEE